MIMREDIQVFSDIVSDVLYRIWIDRSYDTRHITSILDSTLMNLHTSNQIPLKAESTVSSYSTTQSLISTNTSLVSIPQSFTNSSYLESFNKFEDLKYEEEGEEEDGCVECADGDDHKVRIIDDALFVGNEENMKYRGHLEMVRGAFWAEAGEQEGSRTNKKIIWHDGMRVVVRREPCEVWWLETCDRSVGKLVDCDGKGGGEIYLCEMKERFLLGNELHKVEKLSDSLLTVETRGGNRFMIYLHEDRLSVYRLDSRVRVYHSIVAFPVFRL